MRLQELLKPKTGKTVVVPFPHEPAILDCIKQALEEKLAEFILIGNKSLIEKAAGGAIERCEILARNEDKAAAELAADLLTEGRAHVLMKGLVSTKLFTRAILEKKRGLVPRGGLLSHVGIYDIPSYHKALLITDGGINIMPVFEEKVEILNNAIALALKLGINMPKIACIAPVEKVNEKIPSTVDAFRLSQMAGIFGAALVEGPFGFDIAVSRQAAQIKGINSPVAGDPDILLLPDLNSANAVCKTLTCLCGAKNGGVLTGLNKPVVLTSRSDDRETKLLSLKLGLTLVDDV